MLNPQRVKGRVRAAAAALGAASLGGGCAATGASGEAASAEAPSVAAPATAVSLDPASADLSNGARVYQSLCAFCHGDDGRGGTGGGTSLRVAASPVEIMNVVTGGRNMMPGLGASLSEEQVRDVAFYVADRFSIEAQ